MLAEIPANLTGLKPRLPEVFITAHDALFTQAGLRQTSRADHMPSARA